MKNLVKLICIIAAVAFLGCDNGDTSGAIEIEMVRIPAGTFTMGDDGTQSLASAQPAHQVTLTQGFYMSRYEVTQRQFEAVMGFNPSGFRGQNLPVETVNWYHAIVFSNRLSIRNGRSPAYEMETTTPEVWSTNPDLWGVIPTSSNARWNAVRAVEGSNGYRLPTEAQWEYAARAGTTTPWNTGESITQAQANFGGSGGLNRTSAVGSFPPNAWGLYDMHGNVWEWVWDWFGDYTAAPQTNPVGASSGSFRVIRGGSWNFDAQDLRSARRSAGDPCLDINLDYNWGNYLGFRVVRP